MCRSMPKQKGFTLIEMITVIVIVGILGVGMVNFIGRTTQGYADTATRQQLATIGWIISEKVSRDLRDALPNSFRLNGDASCMEFIPSLAGTDYVSASTLSAASSIEVINFPSYTTPGTNERIAVYPNSITNLYSLPSPGTISSVITSLTAGSDANTRNVNLNSAHQFLTDSPTRRLYVTTDPAMYCFIGSQLLRYSAYGFNNNIPDPVAEGYTGSVIGSEIDLGTGQFAYAAGTLMRTGVVNFSFTLEDDDTQHLIDQEVQIRNVP